jgi:hypothetical protein
MLRKSLMGALVFAGLSFLGPNEAAAIGPVCGHCYYSHAYGWFCADPSEAGEWCYVDIHDPTYCIDGLGGCGNT